MLSYTARRIGQSIISLALLSILFFILVRVGQGAPCYPYALGCVESLHLDEPLANQYLDWLSRILHGDFGVSPAGLPVAITIAQGLPPTAVLIAAGFLLQEVIALPLGLLAALRPYSWLDQALTFGSYVALSLPAFLLGFFLVYLFAVHWNVLPTAHYEDLSIPLLWTPAWFEVLVRNPAFVLGDLLRHLLLPAVALATGGIALDTRLVRAAMLQVLHQEYIRTARAKGVGRRAIIFKHAFRNALLPVITNMALYLPALIGGVVVVETVFTWGGLGYAFSVAIGAGPDFPTLQALVMLSAVAVVVANLLADLSYAWLDPRIRLDVGEER